jgi:cytosine/adenosine deaminase-related metal-dependent hydrolase
MKSLAAQYVITNTGRPLKRAVITTGDDGTIISVEDTTGALKEKHSTEFYNGIIVPGFVNSLNTHPEPSQLISILEELKTLQLKRPDIPLEDLMSWATKNGAIALGEEGQFGRIEPGKKPGLLLIENVDLQKMRLLPESTVRRLI